MPFKLKYLFLYVCLGILGCLLVACNNKKGTIKPNIVLINIDDLGWKDLTYMGNSFYETPNIDALSANGIIFTNGYASAANCAPSRASLMTGQWPQRHGILTVGNSDRGKSETRKLIPIKNKTSLSDSLMLLPKILKKNGYSTCHAGKWHLSTNPLKHGFDENIGGSSAGHPKSYYPPYKNVTLKGKENQRLTDAIMDNTINFINQSSSPFFINYAPYAVHTPIQPVKNLLDKYKNKKGNAGQANVDYATMIENMDMNIGRLIAALKAAGKYENTFIVFTSDNGGLFAVSNQHPLRAGKGSYYEGGIRVPFIFSWKGNIKESQKNDTPISNLDIYPTLLEVAQIEKPASKQLDGTSVLGLLTETKSLPERPLFWHFPIYLQAVTTPNENRDSLFRTRPGSVVRKGDWKLHHYFETNEVELYNLKNDLAEKNNLANKHPQIKDELLQLLNTWRSKTHAPIPNQLNPNYIQ